MATPVYPYRSSEIARAAARVAPWATPVEPIEIVQGEDGIVILTPVAEPISAGEPPADPVVEQLDAGEAVARKPTACGLVITHPADTAPRRRYRLRWSGLDQSTASTLLDWLGGPALGGELAGGEAGAAAGLRAMTIYPDGRGGDAIAVRPLTAPRLSADGPRRDAGGVGGVWRIGLEAEEVG